MGTISQNSAFNPLDYMVVNEKKNNNTAFSPFLLAVLHPFGVCNLYLFASLTRRDLVVGKLSQTNHILSVLKYGMLVCVAQMTDAESSTSCQDQCLLLVLLLGHSVHTMLSMCKFTLLECTELEFREYLNFMLFVLM